MNSATFVREYARTSRRVCAWLKFATICMGLAAILQVTRIGIMLWGHFHRALP